LEGIPAVLCGIGTLFVLPSRPDDAVFLTNAERSWIAAELDRDRREQPSQTVSVLRTLTHPRVWQLAAVLFGFDIGLYATTFYMPQAMKTILAGDSNTLIGLLVLVPHLAGLLAMIVVSRSSDRRLERRYHCAIPLACAGVSLLLLRITQTSPVSIVFWCVAAMGLYSFFGPFFAIPSAFLSGYAAASGIALINSVGNLGGFVGPSMVGAMAEGHNGIYGGLAFAGAMLIVSAALAVLRK